jgi:hypothetical protein
MQSFFKESVGSNISPALANFGSGYVLACALSRIQESTPVCMV